MKHLPGRAIRHLTGRPAPVRVSTRHRIVPCPDCKAAVDQPCISGTGKAMTSGHVARQRMAARALMAEREAEANGTQEA